MAAAGNSVLPNEQLNHALFLLDVHQHEVLRITKLKHKIANYL